MSRFYVSLNLITLGIFTVMAAPVSAQSPALVEQGMKIYVDQKCSICHSIAGKGNPKGVLEGVATKLSADEIRQWLVNAVEMAKKTGSTKKPVMKNYAKLPKEDIDALVAYMQSLK